MNYNGGVPPAQAPGRQFSDQTNPGNPNAQYQSPIGGGFGGNSGPEFDLTADFPSLGGGGSGKQPVAYARMAALPPKQNLNPQFSIQNEEFPALGGGGPGGSGPAPGQQPQGLGNGGQVYQQRAQGGGNFGNPGGPPNQSIGGQQHNNPQQQQSSGQNNQNPLGFSNQPPQNTVSNPGQLGNPHQGPGPGQIGGNQHHSNLGGLNQNQNSNVMNGGIGIAGGNTSSAIGGGTSNNPNNNMGNPTNNTNIGGGQPLGGTPQGGFGPQGGGGGSAPSSTGGGGAGDGAAISGDYGLLGLLSVIRMSDPDKNTLSLGSDLTSLGLNLNSSESLYNNFASPWADKPTTREPQYQLPMCYYMQPPALKTGHLSKFQLETLFHIFYALPRDVLQAYSAQELYARHWRYHVELKLWFRRSEESPPNNPQFIYFDTNSWERRIFQGPISNITSGLLHEDQVKVKFGS